MATTLFISALALFGTANAHIAAFAKGMYCENGTDPSNPNFNNNAPVAPLFNLTQQQYWFQHDRGCDMVPPPEGVFLELPAGGSFTVQLANNQAFSNLSYGGSKVTEWPDGGSHPEDWNGGNVGEGCIQDGGYMHTQNQSMAQGTAFAIAYESDLSKIQMEDLAVFSVLEHTPWHTEATYEVPSAMPACPEDGCTCAWVWLPLGCGQRNMYMQGFKCKVTGATSTTPIAKAQPPVMCDDGTPCVQGAKQMIVFAQQEGNNVVAKGSDSPAYNTRCGFQPGAQNDIFGSGSQASSPTASSAASSIPTTSPSAPLTTSKIPSPSLPLSFSPLPSGPTTMKTITTTIPSHSLPLSFSPLPSQATNIQTSAAETASPTTDIAPTTANSPGGSSMPSASIIHLDCLLEQAKGNGARYECWSA